MKTKRTVGVLLICLAILIILVVVFGEQEEVITDFKFTEVVTIEAGEPDVTETVIPFMLEDDGTYVLCADWDAKGPGMLTGLVIYDEAGKNVFAVTGESVMAESTELTLESGKYEAQYRYLTSEADLQALIEETDAIEYDDVSYAYAAEGTYEMTYHFKVISAGGTSIWFRIGIITGIVVAGILVLIILTATKNDGKMEARYDERQLQERGNGFKVGFFTHIIYDAMLMFLQMMEVNLPVEKAVLLFVGILLSVFTYAIYCVWKDAYISLNENAKRVNIAFIIIAISNILIGIGNMLGGSMIEDGVLTFRCINLICGVLLLAFAIVNGVVQKVRDKEEG